MNVYKSFEVLKYPMISVVISSKGRGKALQRAINSVKKNDFRGEVEVIVAEYENKQDKYDVLEQKSLKGDYLVFFDERHVLGRDLLSKIADACDKGCLAGTCLVKPGKREVFRLLKLGLRNIFDGSKNVKYLVFCHKDYLKIRKFSNGLLKFGVAAKKQGKFKVVKSYLIV